MTKRAMVMIEVQLFDDSTAEEAAEQVFNLLCRDPENAVPAIEVVDSYDAKDLP